MAKAGFFQENPGTTTCFSCGESFDGWEENDDPLVKHLKLVPHCGWAIVASIHPRDSQSSEEYPLSAGMIEARKATFGNRWPHQNKKGWKCKITQVFHNYNSFTNYTDSSSWLWQAGHTRLFLNTMTWLHAHIVI
jgi:hypothetical protein